MCLHPNKLPDGRITPCGSCIECCRAASLDWKVRNYFEAKHCLADGGYMVYVTVTYDEAFVPRMTPADTLLSVIGPVAKFDKKRFQQLDPDICREHLCFDHSHFQKYVKRIRQEIVRSGKEILIRFFFSSEFGGDYEYIDDRGRNRHATHRPHYHGIFYVHAPLDTFDFFVTLVQKKWTFGDVTLTQDPNDIFAPFGLVKDIRPSMYVAKYVGKDKNDDYLDKVLDTCHNLVRALTPTLLAGPGIRSNVLNKFHRLLRPRVFSSAHFGQYVLVDPDNRDYVRACQCKVPLYNKEHDRIEDTVLPLPKVVFRLMTMKAIPEEYLTSEGVISTKYRYFFTPEGEQMDEVRKQLLAKDMQCQIVDYLDSLTPDNRDRFTPLLHVHPSVWPFVWIEYNAGNLTLCGCDWLPELKENICYLMPIFQTLFEEVANYSLECRKAKAAFEKQYKQTKDTALKGAAAYGKKPRKTRFIKTRHVPK